MTLIVKIRSEIPSYQSLKKLITNRGIPETQIPGRVQEVLSNTTGDYALRKESVLHFVNGVRQNKIFNNLKRLANPSKYDSGIVDIAFDLLDYLCNSDLPKFWKMQKSRDGELQDARDKAYGFYENWIETLAGK
ncbi:hypothetical protein J4408_02995 [Candidatus Pacearchaeota archaeon]|nr:hypothetical protein [Candidatus Pacearchaeota archaeon]